MVSRGYAIYTKRTLTSERYEMTNDRSTPHPELSLISLARSVASEDGELPRGAVGTVLHVYPQAQAYEVEFFKPFHTVATVEATAIRE